MEGQEMSEDRITAAIRGAKRNSRERKELTDPNLSDNMIERPDDLSDENYGPRNPSVKAKPEPRYRKDQVSFQHPAKGRDDCDECVHYRDEERTCDLVKGLIQPEDWCRKFELDESKLAQEIEEEEK